VVYTVVWVDIEVTERQLRFDLQNCDLSFSYRTYVKVRVRVPLRLAVYRQSVRLGAEPLETHDQSFFFD
jgi:hypothetical protein